MKKVKKKCKNFIVQGDCLKVLPSLPQANLIFADPPDNRNLGYEGFKDNWGSKKAYSEWMQKVIQTGIATHPAWFWLSVYAHYTYSTWKWQSDANPNLMKYDNSYGGIRSVSITLVIVVRVFALSFASRQNKRLPSTLTRLGRSRFGRKWGTREQTQEVVYPMTYGTSLEYVVRLRNAGPGIQPNIPKLLLSGL